MEYLQAISDVQLLLEDTIETYYINRSEENQSPCIFYIDDCEIDTWLARQVIETSGVSKIVTASNGEEGLKAIKEYYVKHGHLPEVIITDLQMPLMNGFELIRHIKQYACYSDNKTKIILISAGLDEEDVIKINELKIKNILLKPLDKVEFLKIVY